MARRRRGSGRLTVTVEFLTPAAAAASNAGARLQIAQALSDVRNLDYAEASTRLATNLTALQAVQETFYPSGQSVAVQLPALSTVSAGGAGPTAARAPAA